MIRDSEIEQFELALVHLRRFGFPVEVWAQGVFLFRAWRSGLVAEPPADWLADFLGSRRGGRPEEVPLTEERGVLVEGESPA